MISPTGRASAFPFSFPAAPTTAEAASIRIHGLFTTASLSRKKRKTTSSDNWGIDASIEAIDPYLPDEYASIGLSVNFVHTAPTSLGMTVTVHASIIAITDHDVTLSVKAWDEQGEIGHGTHKRSIVLKQTVLDKAEERTKLLMVRQANKQIEEMRR